MEATGSQPHAAMSDVAQQSQQDVEMSKSLSIVSKHTTYNIVKEVDYKEI